MTGGMLAKVFLHFFRHQGRAAITAVGVGGSARRDGVRKGCVLDDIAERPVEDVAEAELLLAQYEPAGVHSSFRAYAGHGGRQVAMGLFFVIV